jgi:sugar lactone lactonase YvrE
LAKQRCKNPPANGLTLDQSASIMLYSIGWKPFDQCLHIALNTALRSKDRNQLHPWLLYLKLFLTALSQLPSVHQNIYRGVKLNLSREYQIGETLTWWGFSSCTSLINILQSEQFFNMTNERTLFTIESYSGKDIRQHSYYQLEEEFLLLPATQFKVEANFNQNNGIHSIRLQEIQQPQSNTNIDVHDQTIIDHVSIEEDGICAGGEESGNKLNQLYYPSAVCVDDDGTLYIADSRNHRIMKWKSEATEGEVIAGGNGQGDQTNQLNWPSDVILDKENDSLIISDKDNRRVVRWSRQNGKNGKIIIADIDCCGLAMDTNGDLYVSDKEKHEVRRWKIGEPNGTLVAGGNGQGKRLDQLNGPAFIFVDEDLSVYVSDRWNHRVMKWVKGAKEGIMVAGGRSRGISLKQLSSPQGVLVDRHGTIYVADCGNNRVVCWFKGATEGVIGAGGNAYGEPPKQFEHPFGLAFDREGHLYVVDHGSHLIQRFTVHQSSNL